MPQNKAGLVVLGEKAFDEITREDLATQKYSREKVSNESLAPGTVVALQTDMGNIAKLKVVKYRELHQRSSDRVIFCNSLPLETGFMTTHLI